MYSVVIPTYNRSGSLLKTLSSVVNQTLPTDNYEVLIIDDGSIDNTEEIVARYKQQVASPEIRYFKIEHGGSAAAKNFGIKQARGEILFFTDDDCIVPSDWLEKILDGYGRHPDVAGAGGWYAPPEDENRFFQKTAHLINTILFYSYCDEEKIIGTLPVSIASVPNVSYKKSVLEEIGGFDENISPLGSVELKYRAMVKFGKQILYVPSRVVHYCPLTTWEYMRRFFRQGRCKQYANQEYFNGKPPLAFDVSFARASKKLFKSFSCFWGKKEISKSDLPAIFVFLAIEVFLNACGSFCERHKQYLDIRCP